MESSKTTRAQRLTSLCCAVLIGLGCDGLNPDAQGGSGTPTAPSDPTPSSITITSPSDGATFTQGESVTFAATAMGAAGENIVIEWSSDRDGVLGEGSPYMDSELSVGTHEITAALVNDDTGATLAEASITVTIAAAPVAPSLGFTKQFVDDPVVAGDPVMLEFRIDNLDPVNGVSGLTFSDDLNAVIPGLVAVDLPGPAPCGAGSLVSGTSVLTLDGGNLPPGGSCSFMATLEVPATAGTFTNRTSDLTAGGQFGAPPAVADLLVTPATLDGVYGPGRFTLDNDSCSPPFFGPAFDGTATISGGGTLLAIGENEVRVSNCTIVDRAGQCSGVGMVGPEAAGWDVGLTFDADGNLVVAEEIRLLLRGDCGGTFTSEPLSKQ